MAAADSLTAPEVAPTAEAAVHDHAGSPALGAPGGPLPSAFDLLDAAALPAGCSIFLDYDGTLAPIAPTPEQALLHPEMRATLQALARVADVNIVSGRDLDDLVGHAGGIEGVTYAGSHGYEVAYRDGQRLVHGRGEHYIAELGAAADTLALLLGNAAGVRIERKRFAVAVHFRLASPMLEGQVRDVVNAVGKRMPRLQVLAGKKVLELRPAGGWNKGTLVELLLAPRDTARRIYYLGDDTTDEDAFRAVRERGAGIYVGHATLTHAAYHLDDVQAVRRWLDALTSSLVLVAR